MENNKEETTGNDLIPEQNGNELEELEELIQTVPYSISIALIKISQINNYIPLPVEKYYEFILPTFYLLRRADGTKYTSTSISTVRSAILSNKLFDRNDQGLYELNVHNALAHVKQLKNKSSEHASSGKKSEKKQKLDYNDFEFNYSPKTPKKNGKLKVIVKSNEYRNVMKKYEKGFNLFDNLLKVSLNDKNILSKLNFDMQYLTEMDLNDDNNTNTHKVIGMLTVFKFFKPFIERSFHSYRTQENIIQKLTELNHEVNSLNIMEE